MWDNTRQKALRHCGGYFTGPIDHISTRIVPEPESAVLLTFVATVWCLRRRRAA